MANKLRGVGEFPGQMAENSVSSDYLEKRMLFKKALKVASATALWMVALLGANSAMAQTMLPTYSAEALTREASATAFGVNSGADGFTAPLVVNERVKYRLGRATTTATYIRLAPSGMAFAAGKLPTLRVDTLAPAVPGGAPPTWDETASAIDGVLASGGARRYMIPGDPAREAAASVRITALITGDTDATVPEAMVTAMGTAGVTLSVHEEEEDAHFGEGTVLQSGATNFFMVASSIGVASATAAPTPHTASAAAQFKQLTTGAGSVSLGGFNVTVTETHLNAAATSLRAAAVTASGEADPAVATPGAPLTAAQMDQLYVQVGIAAAMSQSKFYGANGQGFAYASMFRLNSAATCDGNPPAPGMTGITMYPGMEVAAGADAPDPNEVIGGIKPAPWYLCATIGAENDETIPEGNILMDITLAPALGIRLASPAASSMQGIHVASIMHDGTTVQVPYVTTYDRYNQRLVIVNRSKNDVNFTVSFGTEDGVSAEPETTGMMMVAGGQTLVLKMSDLVTFMGKTRGSATVVLQAGPASVDVATTIVHRETGATDTIVLH